MMRVPLMQLQCGTLVNVNEPSIAELRAGVNNYDWGNQWQSGEFS